MNDNSEKNSKIFPLKKSMSFKTWKFTLSKPRLILPQPKEAQRKAS